jgi:hypothetical protein
MSVRPVPSTQKVRRRDKQLTFTLGASMKLKIASAQEKRIDSRMTDP